MTPEPRLREEYNDRQVEAARRVLVDLGQVLGSFQDCIVVVGGWVPDLLLPDSDEPHVGSIDVDLALDADALSEGRYAELVKMLLSTRRYQQGEDMFRLYSVVDLGDGLDPIRVDVDFLKPPEARTKKNRPKLTEKFRPLDAKGCGAAFKRPEFVVLAGKMIGGQTNKVKLRVASLADFLIMKSYALTGRDKPKDAYDICYCLDRYPGGIEGLAANWKDRRGEKDVAKATHILKEKFEAIDSYGPSQVVAFYNSPEDEERTMQARRAYELVQRLLNLKEGIDPVPNFISEDQIEQALVQKLQHLHGFDALDCRTEDPQDLNDGSGRANKREVILVDRVRQSAVRLNPGIPSKAIEDALEKLLDRRQAMLLVAANQEIYGLLRDGIPVEFDDAQGRPQKERVYLINFNAPDENRYLAVTQFWVRGERGFRRPDVLLYVNGLPLVFIELKNSNVKLKSAFDDNLTNYKREIPQLFLTNAFCVLSNAVETKVGITAEWEHFFVWLRLDDEKEKINREEIMRQGMSLESVIAGLFPRKRLLNYVENFILYYKEKEKIIAQNHQFIGVNRAYEKFLRREELGGKLGVFWHTQGSGKSFSMIFYARKIFRKETGNFTFVVVTDPDDLDGQIYRNFIHTGTVTKEEAAQPKNSEELRKFLGLNKRLVFTLIQKFRWDKGKEYPLLSPRSDIIVFVDEAHRTQYKDLAENMRAGLKNAQYLAFTGTPLLGSQRKTSAWFGEYVSEYNFQQSMDDGATVPLFYRKRVPQVLIQNDDLTGDLAEICEDENLNEAQQAKLENQFAQEIEVIKRDDRLETIAADIVDHFPRRGYLGKGMVVSLDKFTTVKMYDKVQRLWKERVKELRGKIKKAASETEKHVLQKQLDYMRTVEMAVVVSEDAEEEKKFAKQKLDIKPHRERMDRVDAPDADCSGAR